MRTVIRSNVTTLSILIAATLVAGVNLEPQPSASSTLNTIVVPKEGGTTSLHRSGRNLVVAHEETVLFKLGPGERTEALTIVGVDDVDDTFRIDPAWPGAVRVEGGAAGFDVLDLSGPPLADTPSAHELVFTYLNNHDGSVEVLPTGDTAAPKIDYVGLEPISSTINATSVTLNYSGATETITVTDAGGGMTTVDSDVGGELTTFVNPTATLTVNTGVGDDVVDVSSLTLTGSSSFVVNGEGDADTFEVNGSLVLMGGGLATQTESVGVYAPITSMTGALSFAADSVTITNTLGSAGPLSIIPATAGTSIGLGGGGGTLNLDDGELGFLASGFSAITIGDGNSGSINISSATFLDPLILVSGGTVTDNTGVDVTAPSVVFVAEVSPTVLTVAGDFMLAMTSILTIEIGGPNPGSLPTDHDQVIVTGAVAIESGVGLQLVSRGGYVPAGGENLVIVDNDSTDPVTGTFSGMSEGHTISNFLGSGYDATLTYQGGDGNDIVVVVDVPVGLQTFTVS